MNKKTKRIIALIMLAIWPVTMMIALIIFGMKNNKLNSQLEATQEDLIVYKEAYEETFASMQYEYELNELLEMDLENAQEVIYNLKDTEYELVYMGDYKLTHYCIEKYEHICGTGTGLTATGTQVTAGRTVAVDPSVIPYGTEIYIEGYGWRVAEDCGGVVSGAHIDIAVESHDEAITMGTTTGGVWVLVNKGY